MAKKSGKSGAKKKAPPVPRAKTKAKERVAAERAAKPPAEPAAKSAAKPVARPAAGRQAAAAHMRDPLDDFIAAAVLALDLPVEPQWLPAIKTNLQVTLRQASLVTDFALPDDAEPAPVFEA